MTTNLLNKIILFTTDIYIDKMKKEGVVLPKILQNLKSAIITFKYQNKFTNKEKETVLVLNKNEELQKIIHIELAHVIFILTLIKLWVEIIPKKDRPMLNISDKRLKRGKAEYAMRMLQLKKENEQEYKNKKELIDRSVDTAEKFMTFHLNQLDKEVL